MSVSVAKGEVSLLAESWLRLQGRGGFVGLAGLGPLARNRALVWPCRALWRGDWQWPHSVQGWELRHR